MTFERDDSGSAIVKLSPIDSNVLPTGETFYTKIHGVKATFGIGETRTLELTLPYNDCMFMGAEVVYNIHAITPMELYHPQAGLVEQYGFDVNIGDSYSQVSKYGARLPAGLILKCPITNTSGVVKDIGVNFVIYELRPPV